MEACLSRSARTRSQHKEDAYGRAVERVRAHVLSACGLRSVGPHPFFMQTEMDRTLVH